MERAKPTLNNSFELVTKYSDQLGIGEQRWHKLTGMLIEW